MRADSRDGTGCIGRHIRIDVWVAMVLCDATAVRLVGLGAVAVAAMGAGLAGRVAAVDGPAWLDGAHAKLVPALVCHVVVFARLARIAVHHCLAVGFVIALAGGGHYGTPHLRTLGLLVAVVSGGCTRTLLLLAAGQLVVSDRADIGLAMEAGRVCLEGPTVRAQHVAALLWAPPLVAARALVAHGVAVLAWKEAGSKAEDARDTALDRGRVVLEVGARLADERLARRLAAPGHPLGLVHAPKQRIDGSAPRRVVLARAHGVRVLLHALAARVGVCADLEGLLLLLRVLLEPGLLLAGALLVLPRRLDVYLIAVHLFLLAAVLLDGAVFAAGVA
mmetsp:Transcript_17466/g.48250  ORF Transcript_17466/g.48250 Transcript_17466/m.48250 type:complete len:334 (+) Transcript_17466:393-1394(+)